SSSILLMQHSSSSYDSDGGTSSSVGNGFSSVGSSDDGGGAVVMMVWVGDDGGGAIVLVVVALEIKEIVTSSKPDTILSAVSMANRLTTDGINYGICKKKENVRDKKRSNNQVKNQGRNDRNKRQMTGRNFVVTAPDQGQVQHHYAGQHPKCAKCNFHHSGNCPTHGPCNEVGYYTRYCTGRTANERLRLTCYECGEPNHFRRNCPRLNRATTSEENHPNPMLAIKGNYRNQARVLFDFEADYSFISTNFLPLIEMEHSVMSLGYEIEIASGFKVETNKIVRGCRIELEGDTFIIDLIPFGREVHGERPEGNLKHLKTMKVDELKLKDILVVRYFPNVFREDLSGLPSPPSGLIDLPMGGRKFTWINKALLLLTVQAFGKSLLLMHLLLLLLELNDQQLTRAV
nr:hypothetical protein [Tanacetum cinerariifolium]